MIAMKHYNLYLLLAFIFVFSNLFSQKEPTKIVAGIPVNYNEDSVGGYTLSNPLLLRQGAKTAVQIKDSAI